MTDLILDRDSFTLAEQNRPEVQPDPQVFDYEYRDMLTNHGIFAACATLFDNAGLNAMSPKLE